MNPSEGIQDDEDFVEQFKTDHNEQFYVLVKMHLSFLLHMTTEESDCFYEKVTQRKWNHRVPFTKKTKTKHMHENTVLNQDVLQQVHQLVKYLKLEENLVTDGIFRRTGSVERQQDLKSSLLQGSSINFDDGSFTVHDCASVLKSFLADLPEPIITDIQFPMYCQIAESFRLDDANHESKVLQTVQLLFLLLPKENKLLLQDIFELLYLVSTREESNRMSADNLAKLFTLHLLCPRKLAPENLLKDSQMLFGTVAFMIRKYPKLFKIPSQLLLDFRSHCEQGNILNESVKGAAHTVFTFVDNKATAKENEENVTEAALAELYAHIQSLPESSKKRKLVKQFNKQNGHGTPLQVIRSTVPKSNKSLGDSIKKHMFHKKLMKSVKTMSGFGHLKSSSSEEILNTPHTPHIRQKSSSRGRLFCYNSDNSPEINEEPPEKILRSSDSSVGELPRSDNDADLSLDDVSGIPGQYLTSTPACILHRTEEVFTPDCKRRKSMSPITLSAQRMPRAMQETMMTPRSRKPVLLVSGTNINHLAKVNSNLAHLKEEETLNQSDRLSSEVDYDVQLQSTSETPLKLSKSKSDGALLESSFNKVPKLNKTDSPKSLSINFKEYLNSRDMMTTMSSPRDSTFSSRSDDFQSFTEHHTFNSDMGHGVDEKMSESMLYILDGNVPNDSSHDGSGTGEKKLVLKPRQFDENGKPIVFETSF